MQKTEQRSGSPFHAFSQADEYVRTLFLLKSHRVLDELSLRTLRHNYQDLDTVVDIVADAKVGQLTQQRTSDLQASEIQPFVKNAEKFAALSSDVNQEIQAMGFSTNSEELWESNQVLFAYHLIHIATAYLSRLRPVNYAHLSDRKSILLTSPLSENTSNWWKNTSEEHVLRELEWLHMTTLALIDTPQETLLQKKDEALRAGHLFATIALLTRNL